MTKPPRARFVGRTLDELTIDDARSFRHVALYAELAEVLRRDRYTFRTLPGGGASWDRALFLNLTFWSASEGGDVLAGERIAADVVAHVAWHHLAARALGPARGRPAAETLFLGEAIASAFDVYLVGRLLGHAPRSTFLATQVSAMAEAASGAGVGARAFAAFLAELAADPESAFESLRALLFDAATALYAADRAETALDVLTRGSSHRFGPLLHHYELSNWVLYARAYASRAPSARARSVDAALRRAPDPLKWLYNTWVRPAALTPTRASKRRARR